MQATDYRVSDVRISERNDASNRRARVHLLDEINSYGPCSSTIIEAIPDVRPVVG